jgi:hypothetical protein
MLQIIYVYNGLGFTMVMFYKGEGLGNLSIMGY